MEEKEVSQGSLPIGNISSNEIDIKLNNKNRKFDAGNTQSSLYGLLKANRKIKAWIGIEQDGGAKELVPLGVFWSGDWKAPENICSNRQGQAGNSQADNLFYQLCAGK